MTKEKSRTEKSATLQTVGASAAHKVLINGYKASDQLKCGLRLDDTNLPARQWYIGPHPNWFNPELFEELCDFDPELEKLAEESKDLDPVKLNLLKIKIFRVFTQTYLPIIISKFKKILPDLTNYFLVKANYGGLFEADRKEFRESHKKCPFEEIENTDVHRI